MSSIVIFTVAKKTAEQPRQPEVVSLVNNDANREVHALSQGYLTLLACLSKRVHQIGVTVSVSFVRGSY